MIDKLILDKIEKNNRARHLFWNAVPATDTEMHTTLTDSEPESLNKNLQQFADVPAAEKEEKE